MKRICPVDYCVDLSRSGREDLCEFHYRMRLKYGDEYVNKIKKRRLHGWSHKREYRIWQSMKNRCTNENFDGYKDYGGRGIKVCNEWINSFKVFIEDMGPSPSQKHQIDRIDNDGNYEPGNCRWATPTQNARNTRKNIIDINIARMIRKERLDTGLSYGKLALKYNIKRQNAWAICKNILWREE